MKNKLEEFMDIAFGKGYGERTKLIMACHYIFGRQQDSSVSKYEYDKGISFCNNSNYFNLVIYDPAEDEKVTKLFYLVDDIKEIEEKVNTNLLFIENIKKNVFSEHLNPDFKYILDLIFVNDAFNFEVNFIVNDYVSDNDMRILYDELTNNTNLFDYGDFNVYDIRKLNIKYLGEEVQQKGDVLKHGFVFYNPNNVETKISNTFFYETKDEKVLFCTIEANSLINCHHKNGDKIFDRNIRYSISTDSTSKKVDTNIKETILKESEKFVIYNNGITIVTEEMSDIDLKDNKVYLSNFSIVNGAQTVSNLSKFSKLKELTNNMSSVKVVAKIIQPKNGNFDELVEKITRASNNQKPVKPRDFKSNSIEMVNLKAYFKEKGVILKIKRGQSIDSDKKYIKEVLGIKDAFIVSNDELGQQILSLILISPTKSNQNKAKLFNDDFYDKIFNNPFIDENMIFECFNFYINTQNTIKKIIDNMSFVGLDSAASLKKATESWLIALLWIIACNTKDLKRIINIDGLEKVKDINGLVFSGDDSKQNVKYNFDNLLEFIYDCYYELTKLHEDNRDSKNELLSPSAFSFRLEIFEKFVKKMLVSKNIAKMDNSVEKLQSLFE